MDPKALIAKANKKSSAFSRVTNFFNGKGSSRYEEAADLYKQAAIVYKMRKEGRAAGKAYEKASACQRKFDGGIDAPNTLIEAYKAYKQTDPDDAARVLTDAINLFIAQGSFRRAAGFQMDLGAVYENDLDNATWAIKAYEKAGEWYYEDQAEALATKAFLKVADLAALIGNYALAVEKYEQVAKQDLNDPLARWSLKDYFFKACLCHIAALDLVAADRSLNQYVEWDPGFANSREYQLLHDVILATKEGDEKQFSIVLYEYDQFSRLDRWKTSMFLKVKRNILAAEDDIL